MGRNVTPKGKKANPAQKPDRSDELRSQSFKLADALADELHTALGTIEENLATLADVYLCLDPDRQYGLVERLECLGRNIDQFSAVATVYNHGFGLFEKVARELAHDDHDPNDDTDEDEDEVVLPPTKRTRQPVAHS